MTLAAIALDKNTKLLVVLLCTHWIVRYFKTHEQSYSQFFNNNLFFHVFMYTSGMNYEQTESKAY